MAASNVLLVLVDQLPAHALTMYGGRGLRTPALDRFAEGALRMNASYTVCPQSVPSRVSLFTGNFPSRNGKVSVFEADHLQKDDASLLDLLSERNYRLGLVGLNDAFSDGFLWKRFETVEEYGHYGKKRGDLRPEDEAVASYLRSGLRLDGALDEVVHGEPIREGLIRKPLPFAPDVCPAFRIAEDAWNFMRVPSLRPFFLVVGFPDPHFPNIAPEPWHDLYPPESVDPSEGADIIWENHPFKHFVQSQVSGFARFTEEERRRIIGIYRGQVSMVDDAFGRLIKNMEAGGLLQDTLVVFTASNGDFAGRYGLIGKTGGFMDALIRVPLLFRGAGVRPGVSDAKVQNIDLMPTILEWLGGTAPDDLDGMPFTDVLRGGAVPLHRGALFAEYGEAGSPPPPIPLDQFEEVAVAWEKAEGRFWFTPYTMKGRSMMVRTDHFKYVYNSGDREEFYDLVRDPLETENLAEDPLVREEKRTLQNELMDWLLRAAIRRHSPTPDLTN